MVDEIIKWLARFNTLWGWLVGLGTGALAITGLYRKHYYRVCRTLAVGDSLHHHFGNEAPRKLLEEIKCKNRDNGIQEVRLQFIENRIGIALYLCGIDGSCNWASDSLTEMFGIDREAFHGNDWLKAVLNEDRKSVYESWIYAVNNKMPFEKEYQVLNKRTNEQFRVVSKAFPVVVKEELLCYVGVVERVK